MNHFVKAVSLLTISLFLLSASIDATLDRLESGHSQLSVYTRGGHLVTVYHGNLSELAAANRTLPTKLPLFLRRGHTSTNAGETGWL